MSVFCIQRGCLLLAVSAVACRPASRVEATPSPQAIQEVCLAVLYPTLIVTARDANGRPVAIGATVRVRKSGSKGNLIAPEQSGSDSSRLAVVGGGNGLLDVYVSKPYYATTAILGVLVKRQRCGVITSYLSATLNLAPDAPSVRQVVLPHSDFNYDAGLSERLKAYVEAADGVSRDVTWSSRDTSVATVSRDGTFTAVCRRTRGKTWIVASSVVAPAIKDSVRVEVWPGDQPACAGHR